MTSQFTTSSPAPHSTQSRPQKDYQAAFGELQSRYGFGGFPLPLPKSDSKTRKWYKWGSSSSSTASLLSSTTCSDAPPVSRPTVPTQEGLTDAEMRLGKLMAEHGHGPSSQTYLTYFSHK